MDLYCIFLAMARNSTVAETSVTRPMSHINRVEQISELDLEGQEDYTDFVDKKLDGTVNDSLIWFELHKL